MKIRIFVGTGGVGKTSVTAASALRSALDGDRCLLLTIDPALRLRTALGLTSAAADQKVPLESISSRGELWAALLDVRATMDRMVRRLGEPRKVEALLHHPVYQFLIASLAGMNELVAIECIDQAMRDGFETLFIDTAPSRHAFEFLDKPEFFVQLINFPMVKLVGRTYKWWQKSASAILGRKSLDLYAGVEGILGATLVRQILDFFSTFQTVAEGYAHRAKRTISLLRDPQTTSFTIVTTPLKSKRDTGYLWNELTRRKFFVDELVVNRLWPNRQVKLSPTASPALRDLVSWYSGVCVSQHQVWDKVSETWSGKIPRLIGLPELPRDVDGVAALVEMAKEMERAAVTKKPPTAPV
jgi:anion-transporting  ArsA/GET3 family ATPase